jgi:hypothetical protein
MKSGIGSSSGSSSVISIVSSFSTESTPMFRISSYVPSYI